LQAKKEDIVSLRVCFLNLRWLVPAVFAMGALVQAGSGPRDPGVRGGSPGAGGPIAGLSAAELAFFNRAREAFLEEDAVAEGLGPRFNMDSCGGCHAQPDIGGSSPFKNPQVEVATKKGARNQVPFFITVDGPVREARFKFNPDASRDGGVHALYTITGRADAADCELSQPDFEAEAAANNLVFRIPTPAFGAGLIEAIRDATILANMNSHLREKRRLGISGHPNRNGNDGTITRFGWKAQNKSLQIFSGEAYNVEQGVTNEIFGNEREEDRRCSFNGTPENQTNYEATDPFEVPIDAVKFAVFAKFLAPPAPDAETPSSHSGRGLFNRIGCAFCHTPSLNTGRSSTRALSEKEARLYSDLLVHHMGPGLADNVIQGAAGPDEFRTAPLWGAGQRIFFLHDGRTNDLLEAIQAHASPAGSEFPESEANAVIAIFNALSNDQKQDILNFLRSL
jgi:CxxC motif-containing protein (DUF1111 family)